MSSEPFRVELRAGGWEGVALLAILEPHRDMLREMGWTYWDSGSDVALQHKDYVTREHHPAFAARILCDVCMEALEKLGKETSDRTGERTWVDITPFGESHYAQAYNEDGHLKTVCRPTRLAALLALLAWTQEDRT